MEGILIGTAILWILSLVLVQPLTSVSVSRRMAAEGVTEASFEILPETKKRYWEGVATRHYILWDVIVLGTAGLIMGLLGYYFIGISFQVKGWPGMLAFIGASFLGVSLGQPRL